MVYKPYDVKQIASECGIHWTIIDKLIKQAEKRFPEWDWQEDFDWYTHCIEIRDFADREAELRRRLKLPLETEAERAVELKKEREEEIEWLLATKEGVKELLRRIYKNELTKKQREELKEKILNRPDLATLIAMYNGEEQDYAKRFLAEMIVAPTREDVKKLLERDTLKIKTSRGWIQSINDVPLAKPMRSIDLMKEITDYKLIGSERLPDATVAVYKKEEPSIQVSPEVGQKIENLATKYSYKEILEMARRHNIQSGSKSQMLNRLLEKNITLT